MNYQNNKSKPDYIDYNAQEISEMPYLMIAYFLNSASKYTTLRAEKENDKELFILADTLYESHFSIIYAHKLLTQDKKISSLIPHWQKIDYLMRANTTAIIVSNSNAKEITTFKNNLADLLYNQVKSEIYKSKDKQNNLPLKIYEAVEILDRTMDVEYLD
jgi:hypothetical protein